MPAFLVSVSCTALLPPISICHLTVNHVNLCRDCLTCSWDLWLTEVGCFLSYVFYLILKSIQQFGFYPSVWKIENSALKVKMPFRWTGINQLPPMNIFTCWPSWKGRDGRACSSAFQDSPGQATKWPCSKEKDIQVLLWQFCIFLFQTLSWGSA